MNRLYVRRFLNSPGHHGGAYVLAVVERIRPDDNLDRWSDFPILELADCSRRVMFDFPLHNASARRNSLRKARLLAEICNRFADALAAEATAISERGRRRS